MRVDAIVYKIKIKYELASIIQPIASIYFSITDSKLGDKYNADLNRLDSSTVSVVVIRADNDTTRGVYCDY